MMQVESGYRLPAPAGTPKAIYSIMISCWWVAVLHRAQADSACRNPYRRERPTFARLRDKLELAADLLFTIGTRLRPMFTELTCAQTGSPP